MADDIRNLFAQLAQPDFQYRQFEEAAAEEAPGHWPIFRFVSQHPKLKRRSAPNIHRAARSHVRPPQEEVSTAPVTERRVGGPGAMFRRYAAPAGQPADDKGRDVRGLLRRLSDEQR